MTVINTLDKMAKSNYAKGKTIKMVNASGEWWDNTKREVKSIEITTSSVLFTVK